MPEWLNGAVSKTVVGRLVDRGFESHPLRFQAMEFTFVFAVRSGKIAEWRLFVRPEQALEAVGLRNQARM